MVHTYGEDWEAFDYNEVKRFTRAQRGFKISEVKRFTRAQRGFKISEAKAMEINSDRLGFRSVYNG